MTVELAGISLDKLTHVAVKERTRIIHHAVPGMSGDIAQTFGRPSVETTFQGIFYGNDAVAELNRLRQAFLELEPVDFFTEAVGEGYFTEVLITDLDIVQTAHYPNQFDFSCTVVEYVEPPEPVSADPFSVVDDDLIAQAIGSVNDVQNALGQVAQLTELIANIPSFGNPTEKLGGLPDQYLGLVTGGTDVASTIRALF